MGLGVDGSASNDASSMLLELKVMNLLHKLQHGSTALSAEDCLYVATRGSAKVLGWEDSIGSLEVGKAADLFMIDSKRLEFAGALFDDASLPIITGTAQVDMTIVGGKVVVKDGRLVNVEEERLAESAQLAANRMVELANVHSSKKKKSTASRFLK
ncbi:guanine deaminase [Halalkalibacter wakoensis JCM 9140]|uniref:Guanine deaminase n=1 Tax=Halalkalibacter wakoensis JCM 9140 TaxID=1236970 RepID=W4Q647_9BACI|nr:amidohydrolase family protein [Halalkalibacter wakoensis]GAE27188.1 guanine deaminase [Halalkalibacter wakoensis JCM 9140]